MNSRNFGIKDCIKNLLIVEYAIMNKLTMKNLQHNVVEILYVNYALIKYPKLININVLFVELKNSLLVEKLLILREFISMIMMTINLINEYIIKYN